MIDTIGYKVLSAEEFEILQAGIFLGSAVDRADGFIHLSTALQLTRTVDRHFPGRTGLVIVAVDLPAMGGDLRWEPARHGQLFPHLYAPLTWSAVLAWGPLDRDKDGTVLHPVV